ncbi:MAG: hypothetical protein EOO33_03805 [Comamonadaceae bacterium]|nr:MAG: hypothetical protein EOO33_03805 [Comamonadaceae bacterium]
MLDGWHRSAVTGVAACLLLACTAAAWSAPAPWYYWRSKIDGKRVCAQASPGPGWERYGEPYDGPGCTARPRVFVIPAR